MNISFPQLADVVRDLPDGGGAGPRAGGREAAGVSRVPDVGDVGGDGGATGGGGDHTAHPEAGSAGAAGGAGPGVALGGDVARPRGRG